jgi:two-component system response regulator (stage 0 sporulation protein F)
MTTRGKGKGGPPPAGTDTPERESPSAPERDHDHDHESGKVPRATRGGGTVLIADDDEDTRTALKQVLSDEGYDVIEAVDGAEALEILARAADGSAPLPDLVLLDFMMPGFSGLGILRLMRRFVQVPPTVIMTGFPDPSVETFARSLGALRVLRKPIFEAELRATVHQAMMLQGRHGRGA